jgi:hypothetical protein
MGPGRPQLRDGTRGVIYSCSLPRGRIQYLRETTDKKGSYSHELGISTLLLKVFPSTAGRELESASRLAAVGVSALPTPHMARVCVSKSSEPKKGYWPNGFGQTGALASL